MPTYKLIYGDGKGRGELSRLLFAAAGVQYEDYRVDFKDEWPKLKPSMPFGAVPVLEVDGKMLPDSSAMALYLAKQFGLAGSDAWEEGLVNAIIQATADVMNHSANIYYAEEAQKGALKKKLTDEVIPQFLGHLDKFIAANGKDGHVVGNKLTAAELAVFNVLDQNLTGDSAQEGKSLEQASKFSNVKAVLDTVKNNDKIASYLKTRPAGQF